MRKIMVILLLLILTCGSLPAQEKSRPASASQTKTQQNKQNDCDSLREQIRKLKHKLWQIRSHRHHRHRHHHKVHGKRIQHKRTHTQPSSKKVVRKAASKVKGGEPKAEEKKLNTAETTTPPVSDSGIIAQVTPTPTPSPVPEVIVTEPKPIAGYESGSWDNFVYGLKYIAIVYQTGIFLPISDTAYYLIYWIAILSLIFGSIGLALWKYQTRRKYKPIKIFPTVRQKTQTVSVTPVPTIDPDFDVTATVKTPEPPTEREDENEDFTLVRRRSPGTSVPRGPRKPKGT